MGPNERNRLVKAGTLTRVGAEFRLNHLSWRLPPTLSLSPEGVGGQEVPTSNLGGPTIERPRLWGFSCAGR